MLKYLLKDTMKINKQNNKKLKVIIISTVLLIGAGSYSVYALMNQQSNNTDSSTQTSNGKSQDIKPDPEPETKTEETIKDTNTDQPTPVTVAPDTNKRTLQLTGTAETTNGTVYIRGGINNSVEFNGKCYASLTGPNGQTIRKETTLLQNAATTDCETIQIPISELSKGQWSIKLNYSSNESSGTSNAFTVQI